MKQFVGKCLCKTGFHNYTVHSFSSFEPNYILGFMQCERCGNKLTVIAIGDKHHPTREISKAINNWVQKGELPE